MHSPSEPVAGAGRALSGVAELVGTETAILRATVGSAAQALGWQGQVTDRAAETSSASRSVLATLREDLHAASQALGSLASDLSTHGATLRSLQADWDALRSDPPRAPGPGGAAGIVDETALLDQQRSLIDRAQHPLASLQEADRDWQATLVRVEASLRDLVPPGTAPDFTRSLVPPEAWEVFQHHRLVDSDAEAALARQVTSGTTAEEMRAVLDGLPADRLEDFLTRHPEVRAVLANDYLPVDADDPVLSGLWEEVGEVDELGQPLDPARIAGVRTYWSTLTPQEQHRLRLLYPTLIGSLDGIPVEHRAAANRLLIQSAIDQEQARLAVLQSRPGNEWLGDQVRDSELDWSVRWVLDEMMSDDAQGLVRDLRLPDQELARSEQRLAFYESLLEPYREALRSGEVADATGTLLGPNERAVLLFDPRGDGRYAEWHGNLDSDNVGIFVPGTSTDMAKINDYARDVRQLSQLAGTGAITWMGVDLPNAVASDATQTRYSADGGRALLRFVEGLGMEDRTVTAIGHSAGGGIVGFADAIGLRVDRTFLVAPSGSGLGIETEGMATPERYPDAGWDGDRREVRRFTMTAPGDLIWIAQQSEELSGVRPDDWGHGSNPNDHEQIIRVETGQFEDGRRLEGPDAHSRVVEPGTDAWRNIIGVVTGGEVIPYREERHNLFFERNVYDDPAYPGTPAVPIDVLLTPEEEDEPLGVTPGPPGWPTPPGELS